MSKGQKSFCDRMRPQLNALFYEYILRISVSEYSCLYYSSHPVINNSIRYFIDRILKGWIDLTDDIRQFVQVRVQVGFVARTGSKQQIPPLEPKTWY